MLRVRLPEARMDELPFGFRWIRAMVVIFFSIAIAARICHPDERTCRDDFVPPLVDFRHVATGFPRERQVMRECATSEMPSTRERCPRRNFALMSLRVFPSFSLLPS